MSTVALARPGITAVLVDGTAVGSGGTESFQIHVQAYNDSYSVKVNDVTGDGHTAPRFQHGGLLYGQFRLVGYMMAANSIGLSNLVADKNGGLPSTASHNLEVRFDLSKKISGDVVVTQVDRQMNKTSPHVQVSISGYWTNGNPTEANHP